jgi:hypothetical protein
VAARRKGRARRSALDAEIKTVAVRKDLPLFHEMEEREGERRH